MSELIRPTELTDADLDHVAGGQPLIQVIAVDVVDINNNNVQVAIPVNAAVAVAVLGQAAAVATQPGRIF